MHDNTISAQFKTLQIIFWALIMGVLVFAVVVSMITDNLHFEIDKDDINTMFIPIFSIGGLIGNTIMFKKSLNSIILQDELSTKISKYQTANIIRAAMLEAPGLFGIVATSTTGNYFFLLFSGLMILVMIYLFPTKEKFKNAVQLSFEEKSKLNSL